MAEKRRALVLGGGGPVGVGWETGLAAGLASAGVGLTAADTVVGTSAGSITGAYLTGGADPVELVDQVGDLFAQSVVGSGVDEVPADGFDAILDLLIGAVVDTGDRTALERYAAVGEVALAAETVPEAAYLGTFELALGGQVWPEGFSCTAVDAANGEPAVWSATSGVPLDRAVASSCSVPGIYPPVTIDGRRYMDGGVRSPLNADLATGHDAAVVVSVMPLELPPELADLADERFQAFFDAQHAEIDALRRSGARVEVIEPDAELLELSGYGMSLMDFSLVTAAAEAGMRLGKASAERVAAIW